MVAYLNQMKFIAPPAHGEFLHADFNSNVTIDITFNFTPSS